MKAIVFDCDGVLVDTEPISVLAWTEALAPSGYRPTAADFAWTMGRTSDDAYGYFAARASLPSRRQLLATIDRLKTAHYESALPVFPDASRTVPALVGSGLALAVASSSFRSNLDFKLALSGFGRYFDATVAGDEVAAGKPAPDLYLEAAVRLGIEPRNCIAIEDTTVGAESATAAGMRAVIVDRGVGQVDERFSVTSELDATTLLDWVAR